LLATTRQAFDLKEIAQTLATPVMIAVARSPRRTQRLIPFTRNATGQNKGSMDLALCLNSRR